MPSISLNLPFFLDGADSANQFWLAYSGGLDSRVLLQLAHESGLNQNGNLKAIHIHHGLHPDADQWAEHCQNQCDQLGIELRIERVQVADGDSLENQARQARYQVFESLLADGDVLLMGHHADDQAETVLQRLMRASGVRGLAGMPETRPLGKGHLLRPLLGFSRAELRAYADERGLKCGLGWIEDPSNIDPRHDRNYLRAEVVPRLAERWPQAVQALSQSAEHCREAEQLCRELAELDLQRCRAGEALSVTALQRLAPHRKANLLRHWIEQHTGVLVDRRRLAQIESELVESAADAEPQLPLGESVLRRYRERLYLLPQLCSQPVDAEASWEWRLDQPQCELRLPFGTLRACQLRGQGLSCPDGAALQVRLRQGGERIRPVGRQQSQALKKLLQQQGVPPWQRQRLPLIYAEETLVAVADLWLAEGHQAASDQLGWVFSWEPFEAPKNG